MMVLFYGSVLENVVFQWLISKEIPENSNGQKDTNQKFLLVVEPEEEDEDNFLSSFTFFFKSMFFLSIWY
jgi:hypothetical protein